MVAMVAVALAAMAETSYVGQFGPAALAGMALVFPFVMLQSMLSAGAMGGGVSSAVSRALGGGDGERASVLAVHALWIGIAAGILFMATNLSDGSVTGCLTPTTPTICSSDPHLTDVLVHAKPILIQGAWLAARAPGGDPSSFEPFKPAMEALLAYWDRPPRRDPRTQLRTWHDQMETGADNSVLSLCPNARSACWSESQAWTLAAPDAMSLLVREHAAMALFADEWAEAAEAAAAHNRERRLRSAKEHRSLAARHRTARDDLTAVLNARLWRADLGYHASWNVSSAEYIEARTYVIAMPLWAGLVNASQAASIARVLSASDMLSPVGLRSTSSLDPRYSNADIIVPYSNWRGPMWVNANAMAAYGLAAYGYNDLALEIASRVVGALAADLRTSGQWHEAYSTDDGSALAAPGFLSWDTLAAELVSNLKQRVNPFELAPRSPLRHSEN
jgi:hypothetical protein